MINQKRVHRSRTYSQGLTLVEMMLTMAILAVVMAVGVLFWNFIQDNFAFSLEGTQSVVEVNDGVRKIVNELREARDGESGAYLLLTAEDNEIEFFSDVDADLETEKIRYWLDDASLYRGVVEPVGFPAEYTSDEEVRLVTDKVDQAGLSLFTYYNEFWPAIELGNPISLQDRLVDTRYVEVTLRVSLFDRVGVEPVTLTQGVFLRNAKTN